MKTLKDKHEITPGTMFVMKEKLRFLNARKGDVHNGIFTTKEKIDYIAVNKDEGILFIDVAFDPWVQVHYFRFLANTNLITIPFRKGKTIKFLKTIFDIKTNTAMKDNET